MEGGYICGMCCGQKTWENVLQSDDLIDELIESAKKNTWPILQPRQPASRCDYHLFFVIAQRLFYRLHKPLSTLTPAFFLSGILRGELSGSPLQWRQGFVWWAKRRTTDATATRISCSPMSVYKILNNFTLTTASQLGVGRRLWESGLPVWAPTKHPTSSSPISYFRNFGLLKLSFPFY